MTTLVPTNKKTVYVGLSGGVDSAVSAALVKRAGYDVTGVFIKIQIQGYPCPAAQDRREAMRVAAHLDIPFIEVDLSREYEERVLATSLAEFARGRTPNPDTLCNREIKFGIFYEWCRAQGADFVATGHYAQVGDGLLYKGKDEQKDQSYFLWAVPQEALLHTLFPVGHLRKAQVRALARAYGLPNARRPDSQGLCFLGDISLQELLAHEVALTPGDVLNVGGKVVGRHEGAALYTLGQRHGFELFAQTPHTPAHFVIAKDIVHNTLTVSEHKFPQGLAATRVVLVETNWFGEPPAEGEVEARFRYRQALILARLRSKTEVMLQEPHYMPLGQSIVLYRGEQCLGGGIVENATLSE